MEKEHSLLVSVSKLCPKQDISKYFPEFDLGAEVEFKSILGMQGELLKTVTT